MGAWAQKREINDALELGEVAASATSRTHAMSSTFGVKFCRLGASRIIPSFIGHPARVRTYTPKAAPTDRVS